MNPEQEALLVQAQDSLAAARAIDALGHHGFAASRAYYSMFYVAEAFLLGKGLAFSKHAGVHSAFSQHFVRTGVVEPQYARYLISGMETRHVGDYGREKKVSPEEAQDTIHHAELFLELAERLIGPIPPDEKNTEDGE
jgi:uncharacterized protein (UPF0332 family)